jgi:SAM-dependent methyltransferase
MPTVEANHNFWAGIYDWQRQGEEWSEAWGTSEAQWFSTLYPRIQAYMPPAPVEGFRILEIATGYGRWTNYLRQHCGSMIGVDLSETCIAHCRQRFAGDPRLEFEVTDGRSLAMVEDGTIDFAFSFDSLVHADDDVFGPYLEQLARKLKLNGVGFIHHSNLGEFPQPEPPKRGRIGKRIDRALGRKRAPVNDNPSWHSPTMTAVKFVDYARQAGLKVISQEKINWVVADPTNCLSVFTQPGSMFATEMQIVVNPNFMREAELAAAHSHIYRRPAMDREKA